MNAYVETMGKGIENLKPREKQEVLRNRFQNESKKIWRRVVLKGASSKVGDNFLNNALHHFVNQKREFAHDCNRLKMYKRQNFMTLLHNNTIKSISNTAKSSILIVILYHLKS